MSGFIIGALFGHVSNWIWRGIDTYYTVVVIADILIVWSIARLIIAAFVGREPNYDLSA